MGRVGGTETGGEGRKQKEGMEEGMGKGERGNGRDGTGHGGRGNKKKLQFLAPPLYTRTDFPARSAFRFSACLELAATNSSEQRLSVFKSRLSLRLSLNTDPTCRLRLFSYNQTYQRGAGDRLALYKFCYYYSPYTDVRF